MRIILFASIILFVLSGIATADDFKPDKVNRCGGEGLTHVKVAYGDGKFIVDAVVRSRASTKGELRFQLYPDRDSELGVDYTRVSVTIAGKPNGNNGWLSEENSRTAHYISVCVPQNTKEGTYTYSVTFTDKDANPNKVIGLVDPKVIIDP